MPAAGAPAAAPLEVVAAGMAPPMAMHLMPPSVHGASMPMHTVSESFMPSEGATVAMGGDATSAPIPGAGAETYDGIVIEELD